VRPSPSLSVALSPLAAVYGGAVRLRAALYRHHMLRSRRLDGAVISVGNLTVGGTGKTPMVLWLAERLLAEGLRPAILTRGYRGKANRNGGQATADEPALLQRRLAGRVPLGVGKDRYLSGQLLGRQGIQWFILDDGFQHLGLVRDADIVLVDAMDPFGGGRLLPAGRLREPRSALTRADAVVITRADHAPAVEAIIRRFTNAPIFYAHTELESIARVSGTAEELPSGKSPEIKFLAFCGIGNPAAFFYDLGRWGVSIVGESVFRDHHKYQASDLAKLERLASAAGAGAMVCTEKDEFNLPGRMETRLPVYACRIRLALLDGDGFWNTVLETVRRRRPVNHR